MARGRVRQVLDEQPGAAEDKWVDSKNWVAVKKLNFSYFIGGTVLGIIHTHYGILI